MFNLLPQQDQRDLVSDSRLRFSVVGLLLFGSLGTVALIALAPSFLVSYQKEVLTQKNITFLKEEIALRSKDSLSDTLAFATKEIGVLGVASSTLYAYELVADVIRSKTDSIKITGIQVTRANNGNSGITVMGQADDREALLEFKRVLDNDKVFESVAVPPANFAAAADINFSILIKTK